MVQEWINVYKFSGQCLPQGYSMCLNLCGRAYLHHLMLGGRCPACASGLPPIDPLSVKFFKQLQFETNLKLGLSPCRLIDETGIYRQKCTESSGTIIVTLTRGGRKYRINFAIRDFGEMTEEFAARARDRLFAAGAQELEKVLEELVNEKNEFLAMK